MRDRGSVLVMPCLSERCGYQPAAIFARAAIVVPEIYGIRPSSAAWYCASGECANISYATEDITRLQIAGARIEEKQTQKNVQLWSARCYSCGKHLTVPSEMTISVADVPTHPDIVRTQCPMCRATVIQSVVRVDSIRVMGLGARPMLDGDVGVLIADELLTIRTMPDAELFGLLTQVDR